MKKARWTTFAVLLGTGFLSFSAAAPVQETQGFGSDRWDLANAKFVDFLGRKALMGTAFMKDVRFNNGTIEVDIAVSTDRARSYPGIVFRVQPNRDWERVYIRPHRHTLYGDVLQYVASFNGVDSWQFYNGYGATAPAVIPVKEWFHVRIEVSGTQARVFLGNAAKPALLIPDLKHGLSRGTVGVMGPMDGTAYFSNFTFREDDSLIFDEIPPVDESPGAVLDWQVSKPFPLTKIDIEKSPAAQNLGDLAWKPLTAEAGGLVDISRLYPRTNEPDLVFAKTFIRSDAEEVRRFDIGYSDIIAVFLNGRPIFAGDSRYQYRDTSFLGIAGYFDSIFLPLRKGENELLIAVGEVSGGWGFMVRDGRAVFALPGMDKKWETPNDLLIPESAAYDPVRDCLYVSNYDAYNPSRAEGRQFITKVSMDGKIEALQWVGGLKNPTGLCVVGDKLYAVERQSIAEIEIPQAKVLVRYPIPGAMMPNDIDAAPDGALYVSDSNRGAIFRLADGKIEEWLRSPEIARPNGVLADRGKLYVGTNAEGKLKTVDLATKEIKTVAAIGQGIIDGLAAIGGGNILVSHNEGRLYRVTPDGWVAKILDTTVIARNIADFTFIPKKGLIVFPTFTDNRVIAYKLTLPMLMSYRTDAEWDKNDLARDARYQIDKALDAVGIKPGMTMGEVGAGTGYVVFKLARRVGPTGKVYGEDIKASYLDKLKMRAAQRGLKNIETILGIPDDPLLPKGIFDMILMHATIQFVDKPVELFDAMIPSLKPGGKIVVIESEGDKAVDLSGNPVPGSLRREDYLEMFGKTKLKIDRIDDQVVPHNTVFILSRK